MTLFVDLDSTLADFDRHYFECFGIVPDKEADNVDWKKVREFPDFYLHMPPKPDMQD